MAASRIPGPIGTSGVPQNLDDGTMIRALSPLPGPIGLFRASAEVFSHFGSMVLIPPKPIYQTAKPAVQLLRQGNRGPEVDKLQRLLNLRTQPSSNLKVDGVFGPVTLHAVQQYQKGVSSAADGIVGKDTWYHLLKGDKATVLQPPIRPLQAATAGSNKTAASQPPMPAPSPLAISTPAAGILEWPLEDKFAEALRRTAPKLPGSMRHEFEALLTPTSLGIMAGTLVVWAGSHAFGVGEIVDIALLAGGAFFLGMAVFDVAGELGDFLVITSNATEENELNKAASHLARAIAIMGIAAFIALLAKVAKGRGGGKGRAAETPPKPIEEPQPSRPKSPPKPRSEEPQPKHQKKAPVKYGKRGRYTEPGAQPPTKQQIQEMEAAKARANLPPPERASWPEILSDEAATFKRPPEPVELPEGSKLYRVIDSLSKPNGSYWTTTDPRTVSEAQWRSGAAVNGEWNGDGAFVEYEVPKGGMKVWSGEAASQMSSDGANMLSGGGNQVWVPPGSTQASTPISTGFIK